MNVIPPAAAVELVSMGSPARAFVLKPTRHPVAGPAPRWSLDALSDFRASVSGPDYPCHFGRQALRDRNITVMPVEGNDVSELASELSAFCEEICATPKRRRVFAAFFGELEEETSACPHASHERYGGRFWAVLQRLHELDTCGCPADAPASPADPKWEFCYQATPMFVFSAAPPHHQRPSRRLGRQLVIMFQPRNVFVGIEGGTKAGDAARRAVRRKLAPWDEAPLHPSMGNYGDPSNLEWRRYFIPDAAHDMWPACPLVAREATARHAFSPHWISPGLPATSTPSVATEPTFLPNTADRSQP